MTREEILSAVKEGIMTIEEASAELNRKEQKALSCKVSQKGAVSVYGLQRMPVTLYAGQWERLLGFSEHIRQFLADNKGKLATKKAETEAEKAEKAETEAAKPKAPSAREVMANMGNRKSA